MYSLSSTEAKFNVYILPVIGVILSERFDSDGFALITYLPPSSFFSCSSELELRSFSLIRPCTVKYFSAPFSNLISILFEFFAIRGRIL